MQCQRFRRRVRNKQHRVRRRFRLINRPEVAIIAPGKIMERPVFIGDDIGRAKLMNLSVSCDHRVVDGWDAASFVAALKQKIEAPALLFQA